MNEIAPVFVFSTGRCGSTVLSQMLNKHPDILSVSEFFSVLGLRAFPGKRVTGEWMWRLYSEPAGRTTITAREYPGGLLYPFEDPEARFDIATLPPIMAVTLPHLTNRYEELYDEIERFVRAQPKALPGVHFRALFDWLCARLGKKIWIERSGGSLFMASRLLRHFPDARVVHLFRDGRETTLSMNKHPPTRLGLAVMRRAKRRGIDLYRLLERLERSDRLTYMLVAWSRQRSNVESLQSERITLPEVAEFWVSMIETGHRVFGRFGPNRLFNLRFEDLQENAERETLRLIRFISPELENKTWIAEAIGIPHRTPSKFGHLDPATQRAITEACRPGLERLGYTA